jgi:hypothetical protein
MDDNAELPALATMAGSTLEEENGEGVCACL